MLEAANRIGFREIYRTVVDILASPILDVSAAGLAQLDLWRHSLAAALAGKILAENTGIADEELPLLHWLPDFAVAPPEDSLRLFGLSPASLLDYDEILRDMLDREQRRLRAGL